MVIQGGIADRTRCIHKGDKILSINGVSLKAKPLQEAIEVSAYSYTRLKKIQNCQLEVTSYNQRGET